MRLTELIACVCRALAQGDTVGLLWGADAGNLTGKRFGFADRQKWTGETKGGLCWTASASIDLYMYLLQSSMRVYKPLSPFFRLR